jgi:predicted  nucleic acid-binding Zn-ribbon protein
VSAQGTKPAVAERIDVEALPFDQYQRYRLVTDLLAEVRPKDQRLRVLDVGGRTGLLRAFLPDDDVALVDLEPSDVPGLVLGDGSALPFQSKSFDVVAAFDTLEHVPPRLRDAFVSECARVARKWVFLAGPYQSKEVDEAEEILQRFLVDKLEIEHRYLAEHRHNGLPSMDHTAAILAKSGAQVAEVGHGNLERWLALMSVSMYLDHEPHLRPLAARLFRFYNAGLYASDHASPVYRHAVVAAFGGAKLPRGTQNLEAPVAPRGTLQRFREVTDELVRFDRAREDWREERARLAEILATLERDLAGHRSSLEEERARAAEKARVIETLQTDLTGHRASLAALAQDLETEREQGARVRAELQADLDAHRTSLADLERRVAEHGAAQAEIENQLERTRAVVADLEADLAGHRLALEEARQIITEQSAGLEEARATIAELDGHRAELENQVAAFHAVRTALEADLTAHRAVVESLQSEARDLRATYAATLVHHEAQIAAHRAVEADLEKRLAEHRAVLDDVQADLAGHRLLATDLRAEVESARKEQARLQDELDRAQQDIAQKRAEIAAAAEAMRRDDALITALRGELKNRWKSIRRAFGPKRATPGEA